MQLFIYHDISFISHRILAQDAFTIDGFSIWKKVRDGKNCAFLNPIGKDPNLARRVHACKFIKN